MHRNNVIVIISEKIEVFGNFKKACMIKGLPYHSLKIKKFPVEHNEMFIHKVKFI